MRTNGQNYRFYAERSQLIITMIDRGLKQY